MTSPVVAVVAAALRAHTIQRAPIRSYPTTFRCTGSDCDWSVQAEDGEEQGSAHVAEAVVEAQREAATIRTVEQLDVLPRGSIVVFADGSADQRGMDQGDGNDWTWSRGALEDLLSVGAAQVVWRPEWRVGVAVDGSPS